MIVDWLEQGSKMPETPPIMPTNRTAFLTMIACSEGTEGIGDRGYNALFGGKTFSSYADHPRISTFIPRLGIYTTAAGRYQVLAHIFDSYKASLSLKDFSPASQDAIALQIIKECGALDDIDAGRLQTAIGKCAHIWASLPGNNYGQPEKKLADLQTAFTNAGGKLA